MTLADDEHDRLKIGRPEGNRESAGTPDAQIETARSTLLMRVPVSGGAVESGVRPEESNPWGRSSSGSYAARWGACAWALPEAPNNPRTEEAVCVWGGAPCADEREILVLPVDPSGKRRRVQSTGEHPRARESAGVAAVKRGASIAHVVYGGFAQDATNATNVPGEEGEPLGDAFLIDGNMKWRALKPLGGTSPTPRGGHAFVPVASNRAFVFGGRGADGTHLGDAWILELHSTAAVSSGWSGKNVDARWERSPEVAPGAPRPGAREATGAAFVPPSVRENERWTFLGNMVRQLDPKQNKSANLTSPNDKGTSDDKTGDKPTEGAYGGKRGEVWIFGGSTESGGVLNDMWRYDVDTCAWTRSTIPHKRQNDKAPVWPPARFGHATCVVPCGELEPWCAKHFEIAEDSPCMVIQGGCGVDGQVLNDVWAFSFERERWTLLSDPAGGMEYTHGRYPAWTEAPNRVDRNRERWTKAPARCAHSCVYIAGALRSFGGFTGTNTLASFHDGVNVYLTANAAEYARSRGAVFGPVEADAVENIDAVENVEVGAAREQPKKPAGRGRTLAGLEPPPPTADGHNTSLDINTEDGGDQGARLTALKGLRWIDQSNDKKTSPTAGNNAVTRLNASSPKAAGVEKLPEADETTRTPSPEASTDFEFGAEEAANVDAGIAAHGDKIEAAVAHIASTSHKRAKIHAASSPAKSPSLAAPAGSTQTEDLPPTVIKPRRHRSGPDTATKPIEPVAEETTPSPDSEMPEEAAVEVGGRGGRGRGGRGARGGRGRGRGRGAKPPNDAHVPEAHWLAPDAVKPIAAPGVRVVSEGSMGDDSLDSQSDASDESGGGEENARALREAEEAEAAAAAAAERAARLKEEAALAEAEASAADIDEEDDDEDEDDFRVVRPGVEPEIDVAAEGNILSMEIDVPSTRVNDSRGSEGKHHRRSTLSVGPTPPSLKGRFQEVGDAWASAGLEVIKDTPAVAPAPVAPSKTPAEKVVEAQEDQELETAAFDLFCAWRRMMSKDESDDAVQAEWEAMDPDPKLHFFEQAAVEKSGGEADITLDVTHKLNGSTADPGTEEAARAAAHAAGKTPHTTTRVLKFDGDDENANAAADADAGLAAAIMDVDYSRKPLGLNNVEEQPGAGVGPDAQPPFASSMGFESAMGGPPGFGADRALLGKKFEDGKITGGFEAGYFLDCVVEGVKCRGVLFSPVLTLQKCGADGSPVVVLPSYCDPGRMVYDGALQSVVFADDAGNTREVWGKDYRNPANPEDKTVKGRAAPYIDGARPAGGVHGTKGTGEPAGEGRGSGETAGPFKGSKGKAAKGSQAKGSRSKDAALPGAKESADGSAPTAPVAVEPAPAPAVEPAVEPAGTKVMPGQGGDVGSGVKRGRGRPKGSKNKTSTDNKRIKLSSPGEAVDRKPPAAAAAVDRVLQLTAGVVTVGEARGRTSLDSSDDDTPIAAMVPRESADPPAAIRSQNPTTTTQPEKRGRGRPNGSTTNKTPGGERTGPSGAEPRSDGSVPVKRGPGRPKGKTIAAGPGYLSSPVANNVNQGLGFTDPLAPDAPPAVPSSGTPPAQVTDTDGNPVKRPRGRPKGFRPSLQPKKTPPPRPMTSPGGSAKDDEVDFEVDRDEDDEPILKPSGTLEDSVKVTPAKRKPGRPKQSRAKGSLE